MYICYVIVAYYFNVDVMEKRNFSVYWIWHSYHFVSRYTTPLECIQLSSSWWFILIIRRFNLANIMWLLIPFSEAAAPSLSFHLLQTGRQTDHTGKLPSITVATSIPLHTHKYLTHIPLSHSYTYGHPLEHFPEKLWRNKTHLHSSSPWNERHLVSLGFTAHHHISPPPYREMDRSGEWTWLYYKLQL